MRKPKKEKKNVLSYFSNIRTALIFSNLTVLIPALLLSLIICIKYTDNTVLKNSTDYTMQLVRQVNSDIDSYISYMENIALLVSCNPDVRDYLFEDNDVEELELVRAKVGTQFATVIESREDIYNIGIMAENGRYMINDDATLLNPYAQMDEKGWYQEALRAQGSCILSPSHVQNVVKDDYKWVVTLSKAIRNPVNAEYEGNVFIDLNYMAISNLCDKISLGERGYIFIVDKDGNVVYHPKQQLLYSGLREEDISRVLENQNSYFMTDQGNRSRLYTISSSPKTGWKVVGVAYVRELEAYKKETQIVYFFTSILLLVLTLITTFILSNAISKPITRLRDSMKEVEKGNFNPAEFGNLGENEIGKLSHSFYKMTQRLKQLMRQNMEEQRQKRQYELRALQAQINPHFLYNTLDSIIWMTEEGNNKEAVLMTSSLAKLLRQSISNEEEEVSIEQEISYARTYLTIQHMRYKDKLDFEIDVEEDILQEKIVKLILQPLVENAIYHGIKYRDARGMLKITGRREADWILLTVEDNGKGMTAEELEHILDPGKEKKGRGVGVYNVNNRLKLYYGELSGLIYESAPGIGTKVTVRIFNVRRQEHDEK